MADFVGPPAPRTYPQTEMAGWQPESQSSLSDLWPLWSSQAADLLSTAALVHRGGIENNPAPGMQSNPGRAAWGLTELLLAHWLIKNHPKLQAVAKTMLPALHTTLAGQNMAQATAAPRTDPRLSTWIKP